MKGLISFPLYIPGTPYARAVQVLISFRHFLSLSLEENLFHHLQLSFSFSLSLLFSLQARSRISLTVKAIVEERRKNGGDANKKGDFLDVLLSVNNLSEEEKVSFVLDALLGGYETTSLLMSMAVFFLGQSPTTLEELKVHFFSFFLF